jgi:hypothetical protein
MCQKVQLRKLNSEPKLTLFSAMTPISVVAKQFHITPMGPMIGVMVSQEMLMAHQCQAMAHFELWVVPKSSVQDTKPETHIVMVSQEGC